MTDLSAFKLHIETVTVCVTSMQSRLATNKDDVYRTIRTVAHINILQEEMLMLDIGGVPFHVSSQAVDSEPSCALAIMAQGGLACDTENLGYPFIDNDPTFFPFILSYVR